MKRRSKLAVALLAAAAYCIILAPSAHAADGVNSLARKVPR